MLDRLRDLLSDAGFWVRSHSLGPILGFAGLLAAACAIAAAFLYVDGVFDDSQAVPIADAPAPAALIGEQLEEPTEASELGFPTFATGNTTRVGGVDPASNAAGVAVATAPTPGVVPAVSFADAEDWMSAIAATSLTAAPIGAPILFSENGVLPATSEAAFEQLAPEGSDETGGSQAFVIGDSLAPEGAEATTIAGDDPAGVAAEVARMRKELTGEDPEHVILVNLNSPAFAMPAAMWAARSGDPILFADKAEIPPATLDVLEELGSPPVYALGPTSVIGDDLLAQVEESGSTATRIEGADPVANAIAFARYTDTETGFGWNINDPGHGLVLANADRPADAAAAAPLANRGAFGPLLLTDSATELPPDLESFLLDIKPGYELDPTRAVYNHVWLIGDRVAISVDLQAQVDELVALAQVSSGTGDELLRPGVDSEPEGTTTTVPGTPPAATTEPSATTTTPPGEPYSESGGLGVP